MNAPEEPAILINGSIDAAVSLSTANVQYRDEVLAASKKLNGLAYPAKEQFELYVSSLAELSAIEKKHVEFEAAQRKKPTAILKAMRDCLNRFLDPLLLEKKRLQNECGAYQLAERREVEKREREAALKLAEAARKEEEAKRKLEAANTEAERMKAELEIERASLTAQAASAALAIPKDAPKGTRTTVKYDFAVMDAKKLIKEIPDLWKPSDENEVLKIDRKGFLKELNNEEDPSNLLPPDGQDSVLHPFGLRVFISVNFTAK